MTNKKQSKTMNVTTSAIKPQQQMALKMDSDYKLSKRQRQLNRKMDKIDQASRKPQKKQFIKNRGLRKMFSNHLSRFGVIVFLIILLASVFAPWIAPYPPGKISLSESLQPPSWNHLFGTDKLGRDVFSRVLFGGRISILVGFGSALGAALIGVFLGSYFGYKGGAGDRVVMRISEIFMAFPQIILVLLLVTMVGQSLSNLLIIFILTGWGSVYRMTRAQMLSIREEDYVEALRAFGLNDFLICFKHMLPNAIGAIAVNITLSTAMFILQETSLSFLGLGVPVQIATWGNIINEANNLSILQDNWWIWLPVGIVISLFVLSINFIGDGLRDSADPTQMG